MKRVLFPLLLLSGPAFAHSDSHVHAHPTDHAALATGLALILVAALALLAKLPK